MKRQLLQVLAALLIITLAGCSKPVMDSSTEAKMEESFGKMQDALDEEDRKAFAEAYAIIITSPDLVERATGRTFKDALNGKTSQELMDIAKRVEVYQQQSERRKAALEEATVLYNDGRYPEALAKYKEAKAAGASDDEVGKRIAELEAMVAGMAYAKDIAVEVEKLQPMSSGSLGLRFSLKNNSDQVITHVRVRVIFRDEKKNVLAQEIYDPIIPTGDGALAGGLLPTNTWEMPTNQFWSPTVRVPSGWTQDNVQVKIVGMVIAGK
jgi:hypothetical protein